MFISRSNEQWMAELCGANPSIQVQAFQDLGRYLFIVGSRFLADRQTGSPYLTGLAQSEIEALAYDVAQQTLIKVWQSLCVESTFEGRAKVTTYATTILRNEITAILRRLKGTTHLPSDWESGGEDMEFQEKWIATQGGTIKAKGSEEEVTLAEIWREVQRISRERLSERQRLAFWLRHWLRLKGEEIADLMAVMYGQRSTRDHIFQLTKEARLKFKSGLAEAGFSTEDLEKVFR